jgi:hypothetical protein
MLEISFFYSGIDPDRGTITHKWKDWLHTLDFDNPNIPQLTSTAFDLKMQRLISGWSTQFKD